MSHQLAFTVDQAQIRKSSILDLIHSIIPYFDLMANEIPPTFWDLLGPNGAFLCTILEKQMRMLEQLQQQNIALQAEVHSAHSNIVDAATAAATTTVQNIQFPCWLSLLLLPFQICQCANSGVQTWRDSIATGAELRGSSTRLSSQSWSHLQHS